MRLQKDTRGNLVCFSLRLAGLPALPYYLRQMMNLESFSPAHQPSESLTWQTAHTSSHWSQSHICRRRSASQGTGPWESLWWSCTGSVWSPSTPLLKRQPGGEWCWRPLLQMAWCQRWFLPFFCLFPFHSHHPVGRQSYCGVWRAQHCLLLHLFTLHSFVPIW